MSAIEINIPPTDTPINIKITFGRKEKPTWGEEKVETKTPSWGEQKTWGEEKRGAEDLGRGEEGIRRPGDMRRPGKRR